MLSNPRLQQAPPSPTPLDPGDPVAQTLAAMGQQGQLPPQAPAASHVPPEASIQGMMSNLVHNTVQAKDSSVGMQALAALMDLLDAPKHAVQSMMGTDQADMDRRLEQLAANIPAPRTMDLLNPTQGLPRYLQEVIQRGETDRRWSPTTAKIAGNIATDPTSLLGVGLFKGLAKGAATQGAPRLVQQTLKAAQGGDEMAGQAMGLLADGIIGLVQKGLAPANAGLTKLFPELPLWTDYAKKTAAMNDALQWLEHRNLDLNTVQNGLKQGSLTMQDVLEYLPKGMQQTIDPAHLELALTRMPATATKSGVAKWATSVTTPTAERGVAYENYKTWLLQDMGLSDPARARNFYTNFTEWWKQQALASISYLEQNAKGGLFGGMLAMGPGGAGRAAADLFDNAGNILKGTPFNIEDAKKLAAAADVPIPASLHEAADRALNAQVGSATAKRLTGSAAGDVLAGAGTGALGAEATDQNPVIGALLGGATLGVLPKVATRLRKSSQGIETVLRERGWVEGMSKEFAADLLHLNDEIAKLMTAPGATGARTVTTRGQVPAIPPSVGTVVAADPAVRGNVAKRGIGEYYHTTDAATAASLIGNSGPDALKGLRVATVPITRVGPNSANVEIKFGRTDQIAASKLVGQGATPTAFRITDAGAPPNEVIERVTFRNPQDLTPDVLQHFQALGWTQTRAKGRNAAVTFENPHFQPWVSTVESVPGRPVQNLTRTSEIENPPVSQSILDDVAALLDPAQGPVSADALRQLLLAQTRMTPQRTEEAARVLDDALYEASRGGIAKSNEFNFDYQDLSPLERAITTVAPFATWYLKAVPFFTKQGIQHPVLASLLQDTVTASAEEKKERGLTGRFTGTLPNQGQSAIMSALVGRPLEAFQNPLASLIPFGSLGRDLSGLQYEDEDMDPVAKGIKTLINVLGVNPLIESGLRVAGAGLYDMKDPSSQNLLRWGAPLGGITALAAKGVENVTGQNPGWNYNPNRGLQVVEETLRETGDAATGAGRQVQDTTELAIERRVDELALKATGKAVSDADPALAPYVRARREHAGPIWEQAKNEIAQEKGAQAALGFVSQSARPDAVLTPQEGEIRESKATALIPADVSRALDTASEQNPKGAPDAKTVALFHAALQKIAAQTGEPIPEIALAAVRAPTNTSLSWLGGEIYRWQSENDPLMRGYGPGGTPEERGLANDFDAMGRAGQGLDPALMQGLIGQNRADAMAQGNLKGAGPIAAVKKVATQEKEVIKSQSPLMEEYLAWRKLNPGKEVADFLKQKYKK